MRKLGSILCLVVALASIIFALFAKNANGFLIGLAFFRTVQTGSFIGMIGNIFGVLLTAGGFAATGYFGLTKDDKRALISSGLMLGLCLLSLVITFFQGTFTLGDIIILLLCTLVLVSLFKES